MTMTSPESAARTIVRGIMRNQPRILIGLDAHWMDLLPRVLGPHYQAVNALAFRVGFSQLERRGIKR